MNVPNPTNHALDIHPDDRDQAFKVRTPGDLSEFVVSARDGRALRAVAVLLMCDHDIAKYSRVVVTD